MNFGKTYPKKSLLFWYQALLVISHQPSMYTFVEAKLDYTCSLVMPFELLKALQIPQLPCKKMKKTLPRWCRLSLTFSVLQRESCLPICYYHWSRDSQRAGEETLLETLLHWISSTTFIWQLGFGFSPWNESFKFSCYSSNIYDEILLV